MNVAVGTPRPAAGLGTSERAATARRIAANTDVRARSPASRFFFALLAALSWRKWGVPSVDAGHELTVAATIAEGGEPYLDIRYFYGPAGVYSLAGAFAVFGTGFTTAFAFGLVQAAAIIAAFYALARQLLRRRPGLPRRPRSSPRSASPAPPSTSSSPTPTRPPSGILFMLLMLLALSRERLDPRRPRGRRRSA